MRDDESLADCWWVLHRGSSIDPRSKRIDRDVGRFDRGVACCDAVSPRGTAQVFAVCWDARTAVYFPPCRVWITSAFDRLPDESGSSEYSTLGGPVSPVWVAVTA